VEQGGHGQRLADVESAQDAGQFRQSAAKPRRSRADRCQRICAGLGSRSLFGAKKPEALRAYLAEISKYEPLDPSTQPLIGRPDPLFIKHFGGDFPALEKAIQEYLTSKSMQAEYVDPIENQTHYVVKSIEKKGRAFAIQLVITTSPAAAKKWKETEEAANKKANFYTIVCKTRAEAERQVQKLQQR
jgi:hypothetical protein